MDVNSYQQAASRTECDQMKSRRRFHAGESVNPDLTPVRVNHACIGITKEGGELLSLIEKWLYYGQEFNKQKFVDELGDVFWYAALLCNALQIQMGDVMAANIAKLRARFPDKYQDSLAANRDYAAEAAAMDAAMKDIVQRMRGDPIEEATSKRREEILEKQILNPRRTRADVLRARNTIEGCCNRHADNQACDCLETALVGADVMSSIVAEKPKCKHCNGTGEVTCEWSSIPTPCPVCHSKSDSGIIGK